MNKLIWRDFHLKRYLLVTFELLFLAYMLFGIRPTLSNSLPRTLLLTLFPLVLLFLTLRIKLTYILYGGVRIGNACNGEYISISLNKSRFLEWDNIKTIKIYKKGIKYPLSINQESFLKIKTIDKNDYESFIANPKGFVKAIKDLKKDHLFAKI